VLQQKEELESLVRHLLPVFGAMGEFLKIATRTAVVKGILPEVIDMPSAFSILTHLNGKAVFQAKEIPFDGDSFLTFSDGTKETVFRVPITIDLLGQRSSNAILYVVQARPPLLLSAGVTEMDFSSPKRPSNVLVIRLLSARLGLPHPPALN